MRYLQLRGPSSSARLGMTCFALRARSARLRVFFAGQLDSQIAELALIDIGGRLRHEVYPAIIFRKGHHVADRLFAADEHDQSVEAEGDPAMRRRSEPEGAEQMPEHRLLLLRVDAKDAEHLLLQFRFVNSDAATTDLDSV